MKRILGYDALNKMTTYFDYIPGEDRSVIYTEQDVEPNLEWSKGLANDDDYTKKGLKKEFMHYAHIPMGIMHEMAIKHGIDLNDTKAIFRAVDIFYPYLKTTKLNHR